MIGMKKPIAVATVLVSAGLALNSCVFETSTGDVSELDVLGSSWCRGEYLKDGNFRYEYYTFYPGELAIHQQMITRRAIFHQYYPPYSDSDIISDVSTYFENWRRNEMGLIHLSRGFRFLRKPNPGVAAREIILNGYWPLTYHLVIDFPAEMNYVVNRVSDDDWNAVTVINNNGGYAHYYLYLSEVGEPLKKFGACPVFFD